MDTNLYLLGWKKLRKIILSCYFLNFLILITICVGKSLDLTCFLNSTLTERGGAGAPGLYIFLYPKDKTTCDSTAITSVLLVKP